MECQTCESLLIARSLRDLDFRQLMDVYEETNLQNAEEAFPHFSQAERSLRTEQSFYTYLKECFFADPMAVYAVWASEGRYVSALRLEQYRDGLLLESLETAPAARGKGYATKLVGAVLAYLAERGSVTVYAHIRKNNLASLAVHRACGFEKILDYALFVDGSFFRNCATYRFQVQ